MRQLTVHRVYAYHASNYTAKNSPAPARAALAEMLDELTRALAELSARPCRILKSESWPVGASLALARLRIECEAGEPTRPFASWYQWQHPVWTWSATSLPTVDCTRVAHGRIEPLALVAPVTPPGTEARP